MNVYVNVCVCVCVLFIWTQRVCFCTCKGTWCIVCYNGNVTFVKTKPCDPWHSGTVLGTVVR